MHKQKTHSGIAHLLIIVTLAVVLIGTVGYIVWQNLTTNQSKSTTNSSSNSSSTSSKTNSTTMAVTYKTYTDSKYQISFQYPSNWTLGSAVFPSSDMPYDNRSMDVFNENGAVVATLVLGIDGIGGTCGDSQTPSYTVIDSTDSSISAAKQVAATFVVTQNSEGEYLGYYGLQDFHTALGDLGSCLFYDLFTSNIKFDGQTYGDISFGNGLVTNNGAGKSFSTLDAAKTYVQSDEYKAIKKMLLSLTY